MKTFLISSESRIDITGLSTREAAALVTGKLGKTSLTELLSGKRVESKGWSISREEEKQAPVQVLSPNVQETIKRANKLGINSIGKKGIRQRNPMRINCTITEAGKAWLAQRGNLPDNLSAAALRQCHGKEYSEIAKTLGWSRDLVAIKLAPMRTMGLVTVEKRSGAIYGRKEC